MAGVGAVADPWLPPADERRHRGRDEADADRLVQPARREEPQHVQVDVPVKVVSHLKGTRPSKNDVCTEVEGQGGCQKQTYYGTYRVVFLLTEKQMLIQFIKLCFTIRRFSCD